MSQLSPRVHRPSPCRVCLVCVADGPFLPAISGRFSRAISGRFSRAISGLLWMWLLRRGRLRQLLLTRFVRTWAMFCLQGGYVLPRRAISRVCAVGAEGSAPCAGYELYLKTEGDALTSLVLLMCGRRRPAGVAWIREDRCCSLALKDLWGVGGPGDVGYWDAGLSLLQKIIFLLKNIVYKKKIRLSDKKYGFRQKIRVQCRKCMRFFQNKIRFSRKIQN